jgi:hypothetical protein
MSRSLTASDLQFSGGTTNTRVRMVDPDNEADVATAAHLHAVLFQEIGPIAQLGERLLRRYCYSYVLRSGLMKAMIIEVDGKPAGLAAYTGEPKKLHGAALRSHFPFLAVELIRAIVAQPSLLFRIPGAARLFWERRRESVPEDEGKFAEVVVFGVLPPYVDRRFIRQTGIHVAEILTNYVLDNIWADGFPRMRGVILASNTRALAFFASRGSRIDPYPSAIRPSYQVWLDLDSGGDKRLPHMKSVGRPTPRPQ